MAVSVRETRSESSFIPGESIREPWTLAVSAGS
jgi:hypothetical protein